MGDYITTSEAAEIIGCVDSRVRQLLRAGTLDGKRLGRDWLVSRNSAEGYSEKERKPGRKPATK
jgi:excisionase family DNA binding protein